MDLLAGVSAIIALPLLILALFVGWLRLGRGADEEGALPLPGPGFLEACKIALLDLKPYEYRCLAKIGKKYGGLFQLRIVGIRFVVITDWRIMRDAFVGQSDVFSGRPYMFVGDTIYQDTTIMLVDGPELKEKRRFVLHNLRNFGFGKVNVLESVVMTEIAKLTDTIDRVEGRSLTINHLFFMPVLNVLYGFIAGKQYAYDDAAILKFEKTLKAIFFCCQTTVDVNFLSWLRFLPPYRDALRTFRRHQRDATKFLDAEIDSHLRRLDPDAEPTNLIDAYLAEMRRRRRRNDDDGTETKAATDADTEAVDGDGDNDAYSRRHLIGIISDLLQAGVDTTMATMEWTLLYMALWPEIQKKLHDEVDRVIGSDRAATFGDLSLMPYLEATILEVHRYSTVVAMSGPHSAMSATTLNGFAIPKRAIVLQNIWAVHYDADLWGDPETFRPERFIDDFGKVVRPDYYIPFSLGGRKCIGESLARIEIFLFVACLLQRYTFGYATGRRPPEMNAKPFQIRQLEDFSLTATLRRP